MTGCSHILPSPRGMGAACYSQGCAEFRQHAKCQSNHCDKSGKAYDREPWGPRYLITKWMDVRGKEFYDEDGCALVRALRHFQAGKVITQEGEQILVRIPAGRPGFPGVLPWR